MPTPVIGADPGLLDHGAHVLGVLGEAIGALQGVGCAGAARVDGDDAELLAQPLDDRLKHLEAIDHGIDEQQRLLAGAVQVVGDPRAVAQREAGRCRLRSMRWRSSVSVRRERGVVALVRGLELAHQAVQVALELERLRARGFEPGSRSAIARALCANSSALG